MARESKNGGSLFAGKGSFAVNLSITQNPARYNLLCLRFRWCFTFTNWVSIYSYVSVVLFLVFILGSLFFFKENCYFYSTRLEIFQVFFLKKATLLGCSFTYCFFFGILFSVVLFFVLCLSMKILLHILLAAGIYVDYLGNHRGSSALNLTDNIL